MNYQHWDGYRDPRFGYGSMLHGFLDAIPAGVKIDKRATVDVHMGIPSSKKGWLKGTHRVCFTMWETDELPNAFSHWVGQYDQIIVPCHHNVELFSKHHDNVHFVPLGVDTKLWAPQPGHKTGPFRFHAGGSLWRRKGLDLVVQAFNNLKLPDAELHIKAAPHAKDVPTNKLGPNIHLHRNWMDLHQQIEWFHQADCYVAPARGEGWGLMPLQAATAGIPTILSRSSGQLEFTNMAAHLIDCRKTQAETIGYWDEPDLDQLTEAMRDIYLNRHTRSDEAITRAKLATGYTWGKAVKALIAAVPTGHLLETDEFVRPEVTMKIRVRRLVNADIGKHHYRLVPGQEYIVPENVHQVLFDSGALEGS